MKKVKRIDDALRQAIIDSGLPQQRIEKETGIARMSIGRFLRGERSLRLDKAAVLAEFLGLELRPKRGK